MAEWIKNCQMCNDGIVIEVEKHKAEGKSEREACKILAEEAARDYPELKDEFNAGAIYGRYRRPYDKTKEKSTEYVSSKHPELMPPNRLNQFFRQRFSEEIITMTEHVKVVADRRSEIDLDYMNGGVIKLLDELRDTITTFYDWE